MKTTTTIRFLILLLFLVMASWTCSQQQNNPCNGTGKEYYSGVEINNILCGYGIDRECMIMEDDKEVYYQTAYAIVKLSVLGEGVDLHINILYKVDPVTRRWYFNTTEVSTGSGGIHSVTEIKGDTAFFRGNGTNDVKKIPLTPDVQLETNLYYPHIVRDFIFGNSEEASYRVYDYITGTIVEKSYKKTGEEDVLLNDTTFHTKVLEETDHSKGSKASIWFDSKTGFPLKTYIVGRTIYYADKSVVEKINKVNFDNIIFSRVNKIIPDFQKLSYMKVKATIESIGEVITPESLNRPGQKFTGTVNDNRIEGVFELEPLKYHGTNAPPFPPDFSGDETLKKYLEPESLIESHDPVLIGEAREITEGSKNSWEAAIRLSKWVSENIQGALPGGTSAINTYKTRLGECGSHSRLLAAFCRAVGIPARLSVGCMYSTYYKGSFGQHAWNEIYMGDAGWIPMDATAFEIDYVDAGHIRLGEKTNFMPKEMEILEYRIEGSDTADANTIPLQYLPYTGKYTNLFRNRVFTFLYQDNGMAVDIPGQMVLALNDPDEEGRWYPKVIRQLCFSFIENGAGQVEEMIITQMVPVLRVQDQDTIPPGIPESFVPYIGTYDLPQAQMKVNVSYMEGTLAIPDILGRTKENLLLSEENGKWTDEGNNYEIEFEKDSTGMMTRMIVAILFHCPKGEPATFLIEPLIIEQGVGEGLKKYTELKTANSGEYIFTEGLMNDLGYRFLAKDKIDDAIAVFGQNVVDYPESFNVYDSLGEAYMRKGENEMAIMNYKKSVAINPDNENGKMMLEKLITSE